MKNKPDAIVFLDLDGTLLTSDLQVASSSVEAIKQLKANNVIPVIATGRTVCEVRHIMDASGIDSIIAMNGQFIQYNGDNIFSNDIDPTVIDRLLQFSKKKGIAISFYNHQVMRISEYNDSAIQFYRYLKQETPPVDPKIYHTQPIQMLLLLCEKGEDNYLQNFPELDFIRNTPYCVDVFNHGGSKAFGIQKLLENKGFVDVPTYAFGDGLNDMEMFDLVDHPIAMENAVLPLKNKAEYITNDHNHDGILNGLRHFNLI